ncbi:MAG TPA: hypothetical protein VF050_10550, partial [Moraxellaceae bacterium]
QMEARPHMPLGMAAFEKLVQTDRRARIYNLDRLRQLNLDHGAEVQIFCAHDPFEFDRHQA